MENFLGQLFDVPRLTSAQRELVFEAAGDLARDTRDEVLLAHAAQALSHEGVLRRLEDTYSPSRSTSSHAPGMKKMDRRMDRGIRSFHDVIVGLGEEADPETATKADELRAGIFPKDVGAITRLIYVDQAAACQDIMSKLHGPFAGHVKFLGLTRKVASLGALVTQYNEMVRLGPVERTSAAEVQAARDRGHLYLLEVVSRVVGMNFDSQNTEHVAARNRVLDVLYTQIAQNRARNQARKGRRRRTAATAENTDTSPAITTEMPLQTAAE